MPCHDTLAPNRNCLECSRMPPLSCRLHFRHRTRGHLRMRAPDHCFFSSDVYLLFSPQFFLMVVSQGYILEDSNSSVFLLPRFHPELLLFSSRGVLASVPPFSVTFVHDHRSGCHLRASFWCCLFFFLRRSLPFQVFPLVPLLPSHKPFFCLTAGPHAARCASPRSCSFLFFRCFCSLLPAARSLKVG